MRDRIAGMAARVAFCWLTAKTRPDDVFGAGFFDLREKVKGLKEQWAQELGAKLQSDLEKDLKGRGYDVRSVALALGKYKGSRFVTSAKVIVGGMTEAKVKELGQYLVRYSPKYVLKSYDAGVAEFNIR